MDPANIRILIGEDDGIVALDLQNQLGQLGYQVEGRTGTPHDMVLLATDLKPDVIVLDFNIDGDTHGLETAKRIHQIAEIPIVFVTTYATDVRESRGATILSTS